MRITFDFGDGNGPLDYTSALVSSAAAANSNDQTTVEAFTVLRSRGAYARCTGTLNAEAAGLQDPVVGCRLVATTDAGSVLFAGYVTAAAQWLATWSETSGAPVRFEALEDAFLENAVPDTSLQPATATSHAVSFSTDKLRLRVNTAAADRANDVTVTGADEPITYVTELFQGDGTTTTFALTAKPFAETGSQMLVTDSFAGAQFRSSVWRFVDTGQHINLGSGGLRLTGGNGFDGQTYMALQQEVELRGGLCAQMSGVLLQPGSDGVLLGMYGNVVTQPNCFAGILVNANAGAQSLQAIVSGAPVGTAVNWSVGHSYTLRVRLYCAEMQRVLTSYQALVDGALETFGGGLIDAPTQLVIELVDEGLASSTPATVLYQGAVADGLARAVFAPVNSISLVGSVALCSLKQQGSLLVTSTLPSGTVVMRRPGTVDTGEDYALHGTDVVFFAGREPVANERVSATYRLSQRAEAREQSAAALAAQHAQGLPGVHAAVCTVRNTEPRSAADCAAAAQALLAWYGSAAYGMSGTCTLADSTGKLSVEPGDVLLLPLSAAAVAVPVKQVAITTQHAVPEVLEHVVTFAQTAANSLGFTVEHTLPADAVLPAPVYAASSTAALPQLTVTVAGTTALQIDAGTTPPVGGGFEVRRHDGGWGPTVSGAPPDTELVLRSPVRSFSVPRAAFAERFYVRMYDGSQTPVYSAQSSVIITHLPTS